MYRKLDNSFIILSFLPPWNFVWFPWRNLKFAMWRKPDNSPDIISPSACINLCTQDASRGWHAMKPWWERMKIMIPQIQKYKNTNTRLIMKNTQSACINFCTSARHFHGLARHHVMVGERMKIMILQIQKYKYNTENEEYKHKNYTMCLH